MRNIIVVVVVLALLAFGAFFFISSSDNTSDPQSTTNNSSSSDSNVNNDSSSTEELVATSSVTIVYSDNGFSPSNSKLIKGGTITWTNSSSRELQVGVDPHPSHTGDKAITNGEFVISLSSGESETVTVGEIGMFGFHNHLDSGDTGTITVE